MPPEPTGRARRVRDLASVMIPTLVGLAGSAMLLFDYLRPTPVFCEEGGGCEAVKQSALAWLGPVPTPALGLFGFVLIGGLALSRGAWARLGLAVATSLGAAAALVFLGYQFSTGVFCKFCVAVDVSALLVAVAAWARARTGWDVATRSPELWASAGAMVLAVGGPIVGGRFITPKVVVPQVIVAERALTPKGKTTIVDFVDFECPFCRMTHAELAPLIEERKDRVRVVRKQVPLRMHPHAMDAARAACCGEQLGHGDQMADALFKAPIEELTPDGCEKVAVSIGLSLDAYKSCVKDPATDAKIKADTEQFRAAKAHGLPTIWIDDLRLEGAQPADVIRVALDQALSRAGS